MLFENSYKRDYLFKNLPEKKRRMIEMDNVSYYSVTDSESADQISEFLVDHLPTKDPAQMTIFDGMACIGGNTFSFAKYFGKVLSNELNPTRFEMLRRNILDVLQIGSIVTSITNMSILDAAFSTDITHYDVLFLDPEWGGPDYKNFKELQLKIGESVLIEEFVLDVFRRRPSCEYVLLKLPLNFDIDHFVEEIGYPHFILHLRKMLVILICRATDHPAISL